MAFALPIRGLTQPSRSVASTATPGRALQTRPGTTIHVLLAEKAKKLRIGSAEPLGRVDGTGRSLRIPAGAYACGP